MERCSGFTLGKAYEGKEGGRLITGSIDLSLYNYLWLRAGFGSERGERAYWQERELLVAEPTRVNTEFRLAAHERETHFMAVAAEPYWLSIETDAAVWQRRLRAHSYAVLIGEQLYRDDAENSYQHYMFPRSLLTIRRARPQYTEEYRQQLRERLQAARPAA